MTEEKTEQPTRRKLQKAYDRGEGPQSDILAFALILLSSVGALYFLSTPLSVRLKHVFHRSFSSLSQASLEGIEIQSLLAPLYSIGPLLLLFFCTLLIFSFLAHFIQQGRLFFWNKKEGKQGRGGRWVQAFALLLLFALIGYFSISSSVPPPLFLSSYEKEAYLFDRIFFLSLATAILLLLFGMGDFFIKKLLFQRKMKMTKTEKREELKQTDRDPPTKAKLLK